MGQTLRVGGLDLARGPPFKNPCLKRLCDCFSFFFLSLFFFTAAIDCFSKRVKVLSMIPNLSKHTMREWSNFTVYESSDDQCLPKQWYKCVLSASRFTNLNFTFSSHCSIVPLMLHTHIHLVLNYWYIPLSIKALRHIGIKYSVKQNFVQFTKTNPYFCPWLYHIAYLPFLILKYVRKVCHNSILCNSSQEVRERSLVFLPRKFTGGISRGDYLTFTYGGELLYLSIFLLWSPPNNFVQQCCLYHVNLNHNAFKSSSGELAATVSCTNNAEHLH